MICMKNLRFSSRPRAKVRRQGPLGSARAQPRNSTFSSLVSDVVLEEFLVSKSRGLGEPSRLDGEGDSTEGEFRDDPLSVTVRLISSFHSRRNDASSSSSFFSSCTSS